MYGTTETQRGKWLKYHVLFGMFDRVLCLIVLITFFWSPFAPPAVSYFAIKNDNSIARRKEILPAGWGMKDVQLLILTETGKVAGIGELGEIYVRR